MRTHVKTALPHFYTRNHVLCKWRYWASNTICTATCSIVIIDDTGISSSSCSVVNSSQTCNRHVLTLRCCEIMIHLAASKYQARSVITHHFAALNVQQLFKIQRSSLIKWHLWTRQCTCGLRKKINSWVTIRFLSRIRSMGEVSIIYYETCLRRNNKRSNFSFFRRLLFKSGACKLKNRLPLYEGSVEDMCRSSMPDKLCLAHSQASYCKQSSLIPVWSMWDLWWTKRHWWGVSSEHFSSQRNYHHIIGSWAYPTWQYRHNNVPAVGCFCLKQVFVG